MPQVPVITSHPHDVKGLHGHQLILEVKAYGTMPLCYQWYFEYDVIHGMLYCVSVHTCNELLYR